MDQVAYFFLADGRVQVDAMPPDYTQRWQRGDFPPPAVSIEHTPESITVRTFETICDRDLWFEVSPSCCDVGKVLRRHARLMVAALDGR
jgi:hypothetical protein